MLCKQLISLLERMHPQTNRPPLRNATIFRQHPRSAFSTALFTHDIKVIHDIPKTEKDQASPEVKIQNDIFVPLNPNDTVQSNPNDARDLKPCSTRSQPPNINLMRKTRRQHNSITMLREEAFPSSQIELAYDDTATQVRAGQSSVNAQFDNLSHSHQTSCIRSSPNSELEPEPDIAIPKDILMPDL